MNLGHLQNSVLRGKSLFVFFKTFSPNTEAQLQSESGPTPQSLPGCEKKGEKSNIVWPRLSYSNAHVCFAFRYLYA